MMEGKNCPFCMPQEDFNAYSVKVADLDVSTLRLSRDQTYRGYCTMIFNRRHTNGLEQLTEEEFTLFHGDLRRAANAIFKATSPDLMNYAALGNVVSHTHYHIIPRYEGDPRWRGPIWLTNMDDMIGKPLKTDAEYAALAADIRRGLAP